MCVVVLHVGDAATLIMYKLSVTAAAPLPLHFSLWCFFDDHVDWRSFYVHTHTHTHTHTPSRLQMRAHTSPSRGVCVSFHMSLSCTCVCLYIMYPHVCVFVLNLFPWGVISPCLFCLYVTVGDLSAHNARACVCVVVVVFLFVFCLTHLFVMLSIINNNGFYKIIAGCCVFTCLVTCD